MKKNILINLLLLSVGSFLFSGTIQSTLSMRFNDITGTSSLSGTVQPVHVAGIKMSLEEGVYAGLDSDGTAGTGKFNDSIASIMAEEPELTIRPYFLLNSFAIFFSKLNTFFPICVEFFRTLMTAWISSLP